MDKVLLTELYNYKLDSNPTVLNCHQSYSDDERNHPILREHVEAAVKALKKGKVTW